MDKKGLLFVSLVILILFIVVTLQAQQPKNTSGCVQCHTSDSILKALYKPQKIDLSEGEG